MTLPLHHPKLSNGRPTGEEGRERLKRPPPLHPASCAGPWLWCHLEAAEEAALMTSVETWLLWPCLTTFSLAGTATSIMTKTKMATKM